MQHYGLFGFIIFFGFQFGDSLSYPFSIVRLDFLKNGQRLGQIINGLVILAKGAVSAPLAA